MKKVFKHFKAQAAAVIALVVSAPFLLTKFLPQKFLLDYLPMGATFFLTACYVPQIIQNYKTKNVESANLGFWLMLNVALTFLLTNAYMVWGLFGTWGYLVTEILNEGLALVVLLQVLYYRKK